MTESGWDDSGNKNPFPKRLIPQLMLLTLTSVQVFSSELICLFPETKQQAKRRRGGGDATPRIRSFDEGSSAFVPCCLVEMFLMNKSSVPLDPPLTRGSFCFS